MNRSFLLLLIAAALPSLAFAPASTKPAQKKPAQTKPAKQDTDRDNLITVETRSLEVLTKASIYYFQVAKKTQFQTFDHELEFITEDRLKAFNAFEDGLKHSDAVRSTCEPVKQLLEILKNNQQELLSSADKSKTVVVKLSFKKASNSVLLKFELYKNINEETKTVDSLGMRITIFGYQDEASDTLINFIKACALENTAWQDIKPWAIGGTVTAAGLAIILGVRRSIVNQTAIETVKPIFEGLAQAITAQLDLYHQYHPASFVHHTHPKCSSGLLSDPVRVAPYFEYTEPTLHEGLWQRLGLTFASGTPRESAHKKSASVVVTAWLPGSFAAFCQTAAWEQVTVADQERIIVVPTSVFLEDVKGYKEQQTAWALTEAQLNVAHGENNDRIAKAFGDGTTEKLQSLAQEAEAHKQRLAAAQQSILMTENLNVGGWSVVVVNDCSTALDVTTDSPVKAFLADLETRVVVTTEKLAQAAKIEAACKITKVEFTVTAEKTTATLQETLAQLVVDALLSTVDGEVTYTEAPTETGTPAKSTKVSKTGKTTLESRRTAKSPIDVTLGSDPRLPLHKEFAHDLEEDCRAEATLAGIEIFTTSTNAYTPELKRFLNRTATGTAGKQSPRVVIVPSPCMNLCEKAEFITALNAANATVVLLNMGETDDYKENTTTTVDTMTITTTTDKNFITQAQTLLASANRAVVIPADITAFTWKGGTKQSNFDDPWRTTSNAAYKSHAALKKIYA